MAVPIVEVSFTESGARFQSLAASTLKLSFEILSLEVLLKIRFA